MPSSNRFYFEVMPSSNRFYFWSWSNFACSHLRRFSAFCVFPSPATQHNMSLSPILRSNSGRTHTVDTNNGPAAVDRVRAKGPADRDRRRAHLQGKAETHRQNVGTAGRGIRGDVEGHPRCMVPEDMGGLHKAVLDRGGQEPVWSSWWRDALDRRAKLST